QSLFIFPPRTITGKAELNGVEQVLIAERLGQKLNGASLHRLDRHRDVAVPCDEDDREFPVCRGELTLQIEAALPRQSDIEYQAGWTIGRIGLEEVGNGCKQLNIHAERSQQTPDRGSDVRIVVDDQDGAWVQPIDATPSNLA